MEKTEKVNALLEELHVIEDIRILDWTIKAVVSLPDYIFSVPASSTGKYHPDYALGEGGLIRHLKAAARIAQELFTISYPFSNEERDIIIAAILLHDGAKHGVTYEKYSKHEHPLIICDYLKDQEFFNDIPQAQEIIDAIASHMGQWNTCNRSRVVLPLPETNVQKFVHLCDYLASRKCLEFNFAV